MEHAREPAGPPPGPAFPYNGPTAPAALIEGFLAEAGYPAGFAWERPARPRTPAEAEREALAADGPVFRAEAARLRAETARLQRMLRDGSARVVLTRGGSAGG